LKACFAIQTIKNAPFHIGKNSEDLPLVGEFKASVFGGCSHLNAGQVRLLHLL